MEVGFSIITGKTPFLLVSYKNTWLSVDMRCIIKIEFWQLQKECARMQRTE